MESQAPREGPVRRRDDALSLLRRDHEQAQSLYEGFQTAGGDDRYFLTSRLMRTLEHYITVEDELFYPVILDQASKRDHRQGQELVRASMKEHQVWRKRITKVKDMLAHDEGYQAQLDELMEQVRRQAEQEEQELFPVVRVLLSDAELMQVADDIRRMKQEVESSLAA